MLNQVAEGVGNDFEMIEWGNYTLSFHMSLLLPCFCMPFHSFFFHGSGGHGGNFAQVRGSYPCPLCNV
jgi:hypothetical protein